MYFSRLPFFLLVSLFLVHRVNAQDSLYTKQVISKLTDKAFHGRGYVNNGEIKAARYLRNEFRKAGLTATSKGYFQNFSFSVNTFPAKMTVEINGEKIIAGKDFIISPSSGSLKGEFKLFTINQPPEYYTNNDFKNTILLIDTLGSNGALNKDVIHTWEKNPLHAAGMFFIKENKLTWSVSTSVDSFCTVQLLRSALPKNASSVKINIVNKYINKHSSQNVIGIVPGASVPDSFVFVTAHYDHLGQMGRETYFPGANDNASGVSMLLNLAHFFERPENRLPYTMVFVCFAGEEAGLLGSKYYTENPTVELNRIRFLLNLDLLGTGDEGLMVVNGSIFPEAFSNLDSINVVHNFLPVINKRGKAHNSDHYYFTEKGVPAFFCYTLGGITAYHDIYDKAETLPLTKYEEVFQLLNIFLKCR
jgi:aminopeptidase YwaD